MAFLNRRTPPHFMTLILLAALSPLTMNTFLPALPTIAADLNSSPEVAGLAVGVFLATSAVLQIFGGFLSDRYGRRPIALWAILAFILSTLAVHFVSTMGQFLALRVVQGLSAVALLVSRAIVHDTEAPENAASKIGYVTMGMAIIPMFSPAVGGLVSAAYGWRAIFTCLAGIGVGVGILCYFDQGETKQRGDVSLSRQFSAYGQLTRSYRFWGYALAAGLGSGAFFAYLGGAPIVGAREYGLDEHMLGLFFGAPAVGYVLGNFLSGINKGRLSVNTMILSGLSLTVASCLISAALSMMGLSSQYTFFGLMTFVGLGNGITLPSTTVGAMQVKPELSGSAGGLASAIIIGCGAILSALAGIVLSNPAYGDRPLLILMATTSVMGIGAALWAHIIEKRRAAEKHT